MTALREPSSRPELLVGATARVVDQNTNSIGVAAPFGRQRCVSALPMAPVVIQKATWLTDNHGFAVADPDGSLLGAPQIVVHRLLSARWTEDTRRLAG